MNDPQYPVPPPELQGYFKEVLEISIFPEVSRKRVMEEIAIDYGFSAERVLTDFEENRELGNLNRNIWARVVEPSSEKPYHELAPIVGRIRVGAATVREEMSLGAYVVAAVANGDVSGLGEIKRLTTVPLQNKAWLKTLLALKDFFQANGRIPKNAELRKFVENSLDADRYALVDTVNWSRTVRLSGLSNLFTLAREQTDRI